MDTCSGTLQTTDDRLLLLVNQQKETKEGSPAWFSIQAEINQIIAENFLRFVNR